MKSKIVVGITQGDTNGIGYEVIIKALANANILEHITPVIYGSSKAFGVYRRLTPEAGEINTNIICSAKEAYQKRVNIINCIDSASTVEPGRATPGSSRAAIVALEMAVKEMKAGYLDVLVTAPFNKKGVAAEGFKYAGHTDYLIESFGAKDGLMFLCSENLKIGVVTSHIPLDKVSATITINMILSKLRLMNSSLKRDFNIVKPKIAVLGLNPHAGDNGLVGRQEIEIIAPAIKAAENEGIDAYGPFPPDGFFANTSGVKYDAVLAMYHDQGLIPFKMVAFDSGVNFTAGLSVVRVSPDHGTAYDIAGRNKANPRSFLSAIFLGVDIFNNRERYDKMYSNPLKAKTPGQDEV